MKAYDKGTDFPIPAAGPCPARCVQIIDLGTHVNPINGKDRRQIFMGYELPTRTFKYEDKNSPGTEIIKPHVLGQFFTLSLSPKASLRKHLEAWLGRPMSAETAKNGFDMELLLDKTAYLSVMHELKDDGSTKAGISTIMPLPPEITCPPRATSLAYFSLDPTEFDAKAVNGLGKFFKEKIMASQEWAGLTGQPGHVGAGMAPASAAAGNEGFDDDIPF
jgi:hypothetical protein